MLENITFQSYSKIDLSPSTRALERSLWTDIRLFRTLPKLFRSRALFRRFFHLHHYETEIYFTGASHLAVSCGVETARPWP